MPVCRQEGTDWCGPRAAEVGSHHNVEEQRGGSKWLLWSDSNTTPVLSDIRKSRVKVEDYLSMKLNSYKTFYRQNTQSDLQLRPLWGADGPVIDRAVHQCGINASRAERSSSCRRTWVTPSGFRVQLPPELPNTETHSEMHFRAKQQALTTFNSTFSATERLGSTNCLCLYLRKKVKVVIQYFWTVSDFSNMGYGFTFQGLGNLQQTNKRLPQL